MSKVIILSWPARALWPNSRVHWAEKAKARKAQRKEAHWAAQMARLVDPGDRRVTLEYRFYTPDARKRDLDNMIAAMKSAQDGVADAMGVDDSEFQISAINAGVNPARSASGRVEVRVIYD